MYNHRKYMRKWRKANPDKVRLAARKWYEKNRKKVIDYGIAYNRDYYHRKVKTSIPFRLAWLLRSRINKVIKRQSTKKNNPTLLMLGAPIEIVRQHLANQFQPGMSWKNHGEWHIDHIKPLSSFNLTKSTEQKKAFHYTNLQPLWAEDNLSKGAQIEL